MLRDFFFCIVLLFLCHVKLVESNCSSRPIKKSCILHLVFLTGFCAWTSAHALKKAGIFAGSPFPICRAWNDICKT